MPDLLIELFSEEIPARMQARAAEDLRARMTDGLVEAGLTYAGAAAFATPRRLTLTVQGLLAESPTLREERKGPRADAPEKAIEGFLRGAGVSRDDLELRDEKKGQVYYATITRPGRPAEAIVAEVLDSTIRNFPWPKSMRWGSGSLRWVRPLHRILCILTDDAGETMVVPLDVDGITASNVTEGHRFMAPGALKVSSFDQYASTLKGHFVMLDPAERAEAIWQDATNQAFAAGMEVVEDRALLTEVAGLVEWPVVLMGAIDAQFLDLPPEVLQTSMKEHQKFFSVRNPKTGRIERFITVANRETADGGATILAGNSRVLSARLADGAFFWQNDLREAKAGGAAWLKALEAVTFHNKLGSQAERVARIAALAGEIAPAVGADADLAAQAARWAKADLPSEMVYEFPELQGLMGRYYAEAAGMPAEVGAAAQEHYSPLGPSDDVPTAPVSVAVALADKLDLLTGFWAIDEKPTGSKDPFALRRAALGVIRLVVENGVRVCLVKAISDAVVEVYCTPIFFHYLYYCESGEPGWKSPWVYDSDDETASEDNPPREILQDAAAYRDAVRHGQLAYMVDVDFSKIDLDGTEAEDQPEIQKIDPCRDISNNLLTFFHDRLKVYLKDQGVRHDIIDACTAMPGNDDLALLVKRATALSDFLKTEDGENLLQGFKRANNILSQAEEKDGVEYSYGADVKFAETDEERALFKALDEGEPKIKATLVEEDFAAAMTAMAALRAPIDAFFNAVQVNTDSQIVRRNRLNLLSRIRTICLEAADLTRIEG
ncbi:glycine--tRNA ligase subunit beta [Roseovarius sp. LXJ103]|uniref:glycine--tRNA ligase subunit beta n=1 Tax=Roseovarius carneus TaxID=2853164 RepID=UPI000D615962|nr:glycine--tRNA ligase subunit beta [Roseovarius carneus]MBZ8118191.1 glycine--tRNA ligase subunit beta [Roseovarius carneus]PWE36080.1 glycine--tRNA ligase subunit beta [Pelagicola sp. LXJ1103]